jgi:hypothetical protein
LGISLKGARRRREGRRRGGVAPARHCCHCCRRGVNACSLRGLRTDYSTGKNPGGQRGAGEQKRPCGAPLRLRAGLGLLRDDRARATHECNQSNATVRNPAHRKAPDPSPSLTFLHLHQLSINSLPSTFKVMCTAFHIKDLDSCPLLPNHHTCKAKDSFIRCFRQRKVAVPQRSLMS